MTSVDRAGAVVGVIALWEDKNALEASEPVVAGSRAEAVSILGGDATVETFEQVVLRLVSGRHEDRVPRRPHGSGAPIQPKLDFDLGPKPKFILTSVAAVRWVNGYSIGLLAEGRNRGDGSLPSVYLIPRPLRQPF